MNGPSLGRMNSEPAKSTVITQDILDRDPVAKETLCKHILIGWRDKKDAYQGEMDERAAKRSKADAEAKVRELMNAIAAGADFDQLMRDNSEDPGFQVKPEGYVVNREAQLVIEFRWLGLRLNVGEVGVVESDYGFHVMKRVE